MKDSGLPDTDSQEHSHLMMLFATERIEDYVVLSLSLAILILILVFH